MSAETTLRDFRAAIQYCGDGVIILKALLSFLIAILASQSSAQDGAIRGRMLCEVMSNRFVAIRDGHSNTNISYGEGFSVGASLTFDYTLDEASGLSVFLGETNSGGVLFDEPFSADKFRGISPVTNNADFRASYSEVTFGHYRMNYKGNDQLYLKRCRDDDWSGYYVQTYVGGQFTQVVTLNCRTFVDAVDEVLARLTILQ